VVLKQQQARRQSVEYTFRNHKDSDVSIDVIERFSRYYEVELHESNYPLSEKEAGKLKFEVSVPADGETILYIEYTASW
jgi:hypothetical protein